MLLKGLRPFIYFLSRARFDDLAMKLFALGLVTCASAATQQWAGTLSFPPFLKSGPLNATVDTVANTASLSWVCVIIY